MNIYVLLKRTFDTEEQITLADGQIKEEGAEYIINPYDEYAVEEAVQIRDQQGGVVTVVTVGSPEAEKQLRTALAMGADQAILINVEDELTQSDPSTTATILAQYLQDKSADLIIAGNVAIDGGSGQVGPRVADMLNIPYITTIIKLEIDGSEVRAVRDEEGDSVTVESSLPLLVTTQQGLNEPRYPSLPGLMKAKKKPLDVLTLADLQLDESKVRAKTKTLEVFLPPKKEAGQILNGELNEQVSKLADMLRHEVKVI